MFPMNLNYVRVKRYGFSFPFIKEYRSQLRQSVTSIPHVTYGKDDFLCSKTFISTLPDAKQQFPSSLRRKGSDFYGNYSFVVDDAVARAVATEVAKYVNTNSDTTVVEVNPGMGKITRHLIQMGIDKITVCDLKDSFWSYEILQQFKKNIQLHLYETKLHRHNYLHWMLPNYMLAGKDASLLIIMINASRLFIRNLIKQVALVDFTYLARDKLYILISENIYHCFCKLHSRHCEFLDIVLIDVVFDMEVLAEFPRSAVLPQVNDLNIKKMYLIMLQRKKVPLILEENILMYWNFVNILSKRKNMPIIPFLEKWAPACGPILISEGLSIWTKIRELSTSDVLVLFKILLTNKECRFALQILESDNLLS